MIGMQAQRFAMTHKSDITLSESQQITLIGKIIGSYEAIVLRNITLPLLQTEFDALTSFVYNPGGSFKPIAKQINVRKFKEAAKIMGKRVYSGGKKMKGLERRREDEIALLLSGKYG